ncbi:MAG: ImmA/IrrE family metallo-endopeptidase [Bacteroidetes bacterium]|nr:ImmA/IrrE family metallo-endopeptidase [Bacteroidota bacterium]
MAFPNRNFYMELSDKVNTLLQEANVFEPPVPIKNIAVNWGARVLPYELGEEVSGILVYDNYKGTIGYNSSNHRVRQRFTIAHELGHLIYHVSDNSGKEMFVDKDFIIKFRSEKDYSPKEIRQEREANAFAAFILMPKQFIFSEIKKSKYKELSETEVIEEFAKLFDVSIPAMTYRFADLNISSY